MAENSTMTASELRRAIEQLENTPWIGSQRSVQPALGAQNTEFEQWVEERMNAIRNSYRHCSCYYCRIQAHSHPCSMCRQPEHGPYCRCYYCHLTPYQNQPMNIQETNGLNSDTTSMAEVGQISAFRVLKVARIPARAIISAGSIDRVLRQADFLPIEPGALVLMAYDVSEKCAIYQQVMLVDSSGNDLIMCDKMGQPLEAMPMRALELEET